MIELEAKSVDTAASDCWTTMSRKVTKGGGWKWTGGAEAEGSLAEGDRAETRAREGGHNEP